MLMQAFLGALAAPSHAMTGFGETILCSSGATSASDAPSPPSPREARDCGCAALCHMAGALAEPPAIPVAVAPFDILLTGPIAQDRSSSPSPRGLPPARAPPRAGFVLPA